MLSTEQGTSGQSRRAGNIPAGQHRSLHGHFVPPHCNPEADRWAPLSSSAPGKTLMNFKNGWRTCQTSTALPGSLDRSTGGVYFKGPQGGSFH